MFQFVQLRRSSVSHLLSHFWIYRNQVNMASSSVVSFEAIRYDVFFSFRGEDTRAAITRHLFKELCQKSIVTYKDDAMLVIGEEISPALLTAIRRWKISAVMFSENYASSWWCLCIYFIVGKYMGNTFYHFSTM